MKKLLALIFFVFIAPVLLVLLAASGLEWGRPEKPRSYRLASLPPGLTKGKEINGPLEAIARARQTGSESELPQGVDPKQWLVEGAPAENGEWEIKFYTANQVPAYTCLLKLNSKGERLQAMNCTSMK